jgi:hypothetical protein
MALIFLVVTGNNLVSGRSRPAVQHVAGSLAASDEPPLPLLLSIDALSAATSSALLAPIVTVIDKSIILTAAGSTTLGSALRANAARLATKPVAFLATPEYAWIWGVYVSTYLAANTIDTICKLAHRPPALPKFIGTSATNIVACVSKDAAFARMFGSKAATAVPLTSLALFSVRDAATVFASFVFPPQLATTLTNCGLQPTASLNVAQLVCPIGVQALTSPVHLLGLDLYNRGRHEVLAQGKGRLRASFTNYVPVTGARMFRVLPAFGIGGIGNRVLRSRLQRAARDRQSQS